MANGDQYTLNQDFYSPLQPDEYGKYSIAGRFSRGDTLTGVDFPPEFLEKATSGARPLFLKKDSKEQAPSNEDAAVQSTPRREETTKKQ